MFRHKVLRKSLLVGLPVVLIVATALVVTKGRFGAFFDHVAGNGAYLGNSLSTDRVIVSDDAMFKKLVADPSLEDYRRVHPDFSRSVSEQVEVPHTAAELSHYAGFLREFEAIVARDGGQRSDATAQRLVRLMYKYREQNNGNPRKIEEGALGGDSERPENFVFYLANAETACGTVAESAIALFRAAGYSARLIILAHEPGRIQADHVLAEYYSTESNRWHIIDPMVDYIGTRSVLEVLSDPQVSQDLNARHGVPHFRLTTTAVIDHRGLMRKLFYYSPNEAGRAATQAAVEAG